MFARALSDQRPTCDVRPNRRVPARRRGLTLTEMVMVLLILASLAAMVVPLIGSVHEQSNRALAASGAADVINNLETFRVSRNRYPQRMDSLLADDGGTLVGYSGLAADNDEAQSPWFEVEDLTTFSGALYPTSLARARISTVMDHDPTQQNPSDSGRILRDFTVSDVTVAVVTNGLVLAAAGVADLDQDGITSLNDIPDSDGDGNPDVKYIAFGIGPQCEVMGETMASPPFHSGADITDYARFIAIFAVFESGQVAELKTVVDSRRVDISSNVSAYRDANQ